MAAEFRRNDLFTRKLRNTYMLQRQSRCVMTLDSDAAAQLTHARILHGMRGTVVHGFREPLAYRAPWVAAATPDGH
jgi:hypothetical protein